MLAFWGNIAENRLCDLQVLAIYQNVIITFSLKRYCSKSALLKSVLSVQIGPLPGAYLGGGIGPWPPFGSPGLQDYIKKWAKLRHAPPPLCKLGIRLWAQNHLILGEKWDEICVTTFLFCSSPDFGRKIGRNLSEDLFFFYSSPDFGRVMERNLSVTISNSDLCSSQIFWSFWPPPFQNPAYAYCPLLATLFVQFWFRKNRTTYDKTRLHICEQRQYVTKVSYVQLN